jgi:GMP synthase (glutamine-hydrolysing)
MADRPWVLLQHVAFEGPGLIAAAAGQAGVSLDVRRLDLGNAVPGPDEIEQVGGLVVMGGPMGAHDDVAHPQLAAERLLLREALAAGTPVLGVCLGAQLLAAAAGADVFVGNAGPEIGLGAVDLTADGRRDPVLGPGGRALPVLHWHSDTFTLPDGATLLASTGRYRHQAFRLGARAYGLQFHVEIDDASAAAMEPHLPDGVVLDRRDLGLVQRTGAGVLARFFAAALPTDGQRAPSC